MAAPPPLAQAIIDAMLAATGPAPTRSGAAGPGMETGVPWFGEANESLSEISDFCERIVELTEKVSGGGDTIQVKIDEINDKALEKLLEPTKTISEALTSVLVNQSLKVSFSSIEGAAAQTLAGAIHEALSPEFGKTQELMGKVYEASEAAAPLEPEAVFQAASAGAAAGRAATTEKTSAAPAKVLEKLLGAVEKLVDPLISKRGGEVGAEVYLGELGIAPKVLEGLKGKLEAAGFGPEKIGLAEEAIAKLGRKYKLATTQTEALFYALAEGGKKAKETFIMLGKSSTTAKEAQKAINKLAAGYGELKSKASAALDAVEGSLGKVIVWGLGMIGALGLTEISISRVGAAFTSLSDLSGKMWTQFQTDSATAADSFNQAADAASSVGLSLEKGVEAFDQIREKGVRSIDQINKTLKVSASAVLTIGGDLGEWAGIIGEIQYDLQLTSQQMSGMIRQASLIQKQFALTATETQGLLKTTQEIEKVMYKMGTHSAETAAGITKALAAAKTLRAGDMMQETMMAMTSAKSYFESSAEVQRNLIMATRTGIISMDDLISGRLMKTVEGQRRANAALSGSYEMTMKAVQGMGEFQAQQYIQAMHGMSGGTNELRKNMQATKIASMSMEEQLDGVNKVLANTDKLSKTQMAIQLKLVTGKEFSGTMSEMKEGIEKWKEAAKMQKQIAQGTKISDALSALGQAVADEETLGPGVFEAKINELMTTQPEMMEKALKGIDPGASQQEIMKHMEAYGAKVEKGNAIIEKQLQQQRDNADPLLALRKAILGPINSLFKTIASGILKMYRMLGPFGPAVIKALGLMAVTLSVIAATMLAIKAIQLASKAAGSVRDMLKSGGQRVLAGIDKMTGKSATGAVSAARDLALLKATTALTWLRTTATAALTGATTMLTGATAAGATATAGGAAATGGFTAAMWAFTTALLANPITLIVAAIAAAIAILVGAVWLLVYGFQEGVTWAKWLGTALLAIVLGPIGPIVAAMILLYDTFFDTGSMLTGLFDMWADSMDWAANLVLGAVDWIVETISTIPDRIVGFIEGLPEMIANMFSGEGTSAVSGAMGKMFEAGYKLAVAWFFKLPLAILKALGSLIIGIPKIFWAILKTIPAIAKAALGVLIDILLWPFRKAVGIIDWLFGTELSGSVDGFIQNIKDAFGFILDIVLFPFHALVWAVKGIWSAIGPVFNFIVKAISFYFKTIWSVISAVVGVITSAFKLLFAVITWPFRMAWKVIKGIWNVFADLFSGGSLTDALGTFGDSVWDAITWPFRAVGDFVMSIFDGVINIFSSLVDSILGIGGAIWDAITWPFRTAWEWVSGLFSGGGGGGIFSSLLDTIMSVAGSILDIITWPFRKAWDIISSIWETIKSVFSMETIMGILSSIGEAIVGLLPWPLSSAIKWFFGDEGEAEGAAEAAAGAGEAAEGAKGGNQLLTELQFLNMTMLASTGYLAQIAGIMLATGAMGPAGAVIALVTGLASSVFGGKTPGTGEASVDAKMSGIEGEIRATRGAEPLEREIKEAGEAGISALVANSSAQLTELQAIRIALESINSGGIKINVNGGGGADTSKSPTTSPKKTRLDTGARAAGGLFS